MQRVSLGEYERTFHFLLFHLLVVGYPYVSFSYSSLKDFEKFDMTSPPEHVKETYAIRKLKCNMKGLRSNIEGKLEPIIFDEEREKVESIQLDIQVLASKNSFMA